jgi:outer membrane protein OmpA-like peptidoglycan-associated protein
MAFRDTFNGPRIRKGLAVTAGFLVLWAVAGFLLLPRFLRPVVERKLAAALHRPVTLSRLSLNPFTLSAALEGLSVKERDGAALFFSFERLSVNLEAISLFKGGPLIRAITLTKPTLALVRHEDGTYNAQDLIDEFTKPKPREEPEKPLRFSLNNIRVEGGTVDFDDRPKRTKHAVRNLTIGIPFLSNIPSKVEITTLPVFEANVNGAPFALRGRTKPFSPTHETAVDLDFTDVDVPYYLGYLPTATPWKLTSGRLDTKLKVAFAEAREGAPALVVSGSAALRKVAAQLGGRPLARCERFEVAVDSLDVFGRRARLASLKAVGPELWVQRSKTGKYSILAALGAPAAATSAKAGAPTPQKAEAPFLVEVDVIGIERGRVHYDDLALPRPFRSDLGDVAISVKGFSTAPGKTASLDVFARSDAGETFRNTGKVSMTPVGLEGEFTAAGLALERYQPFYRELVKFDVDRGTLDLKTRYRFTPGKDGNTTLSSLSAEVASPRLTRRGEKQPFFQAKSVTLGVTALDLAKHEATVGELASAGGVLAVRRDKDGNADITDLMADRPPGAPTRAPAAPWKIVFARFALDGYTVKVDDREPERPARYALTKLNLELRNLSTERGARATLAARFGVDGRGVASAKGPVGLNPIFADLKVDVKRIDLVPLQAYVLPSVRLALARGALTGTGRLAFGEGANGRAKFVYTGNALVSGLLAIEQATRLDFFKWETFSLNGMRAGFNPVFLEAANLDISGLGFDLTIEADGRTNLSKIAGKPAPPDEGEEGSEPEAAAVSPTPPPSPAASAAPPAAPASAEVTPIRIDVLTLRGGRIGLADHFIQPNYAATLTELTGRMTGLSSKAGTVAQLDVRGSLANHSPLEITGSVNPLAATAFADVKGSFHDIDLPPFTPYSGKYAGYAIARGGLTMEVAYKLQNRKLSAHNRFLVDQFEFGDKIESPTATKLPVKLAVSLLKDRNGVIDVDLPVEGSLDDPKFRIGKVVWKLIGNLIVKAATSPFALLGKLFGGGNEEELSSVDFGDGTAVLEDPAKKKLDALARAMEDRPALKLEATGRFSGADSEGLKRLLFERKLKAQKLADLAKKGEAPASVDDVVIDEKERELYLTKAYKREKFDKPRNVLGIAKGLPPGEMESLMLAHIAVTDDDLRQLAFARANAVKDYLTGPGKVAGARVFVLEPGRTPPERKEGARGSRVDFSLR